MPCCLNNRSFCFQHFFSPEIWFCALSQELRNSDKAIPHIENPSCGSSRHGLQSALRNGLSAALILNCTLEDCSVRCQFELLLTGTEEQSSEWTKCVFIFKYYSTDDNLSSLKEATPPPPVTRYCHCYPCGSCFLTQTPLPDFSTTRAHTKLKYKKVYSSGQIYDLLKTFSSL